VGKLLALVFDGGDSEFRTIDGIHGSIFSESVWSEFRFSGVRSLAILFDSVLFNYPICETFQLIDPVFTEQSALIERQICITALFFACCQRSGDCALQH